MSEPGSELRILVVDRADDLVLQVQRITGELSPSPEVVRCERVGSFLDIIDDEGPFDVVLAGQGLANRSGLARLALVHQECPELSIVLAFTSRPNVSLREILLTGAVDLVHFPVEDEALLEVLVTAVDKRRASRPREGRESQRRPEGEGTVVTVTSATGGCGKTFLATNIAYFLHQETGGRACIVDLDLRFGEVPTALRLRPKYTIVDLIQRDDADDLGASIEEYLVEHEAGVHVLAPPKDPEDADQVQAADVIRVLRALRSRFDFVVIDAPAALGEMALAALDISEHIYVISTLDMPSIRKLGLYLGIMEKLKISADNVMLVVNKDERDTGIELKQVAKQFDRELALVLPYAREVSRSLNLGTPVLAYLPNLDVSRALSAGLAPLVPPGGRVDPVPAGGAELPARAGLLARVRQAVNPGPASRRLTT